MYGGGSMGQRPIARRAGSAHRLPPAGGRPRALAVRLGAATTLTLAALGVVAACGTVGSIQLTVTTAADGRDAEVGDRICEMTAGAGDCSLRAAIDETNVAPFTTDRITIAPGVDPTLAIEGANEDANASGDLDVSGTVAILGCGATLDGARLDRVLDHHAGSLTIDHLRITGGEQSGDGPNEKSHPPFVPGNGGFGSGGGLRSRAPLTIADSTITDNRLLYVDVDGAGLDATGGPVHITRSTIRDNLMTGGAAAGAGLHAAGVADLSIVGSVIQGNRIQLESGGVDAWGGGIALDGSVATIDRTTITANVAGSSDGLGLGGGLFARSSTATITRSTLSDDRSNDIGTQEIESQGGSLVIESSTIVNEADNITIEASNASIRSSTTIGRCLGTVVSGGWNVGGPGTIACGITQPTDLAVADLLLGALAANGGPTPTHLPLAGSPLLDRIPVGTAGTCAVATTDQRGEPRPAGPSCDVGAVERQPSDPP